MNPSDEIPADLLTAAANAARPELTASSLNARFGCRRDWDVRPGQLWKASDAATQALVLVVTVSATRVEAVPVSVDPPAYDGACLLVPPARSPLGAPTTLWFGLRTSLPMVVIDRPVGDFASDIVAWVSASDTRHRLHVPSGCEIGTDPSTLFDESLDVAALIEDSMEVLAGSEQRERSEEGAPTEDESPACSPDEDQLMELAKRLNVPLPHVLDLVDGNRPPTVEEQRALIDVLGAAPHVASPPDGLVQVLSQPRHRGIVRQFAADTHSSEHDARLALSHELVASAARGTDRDQRDWAARLDRWASARGYDPDAS